MCRYQNELNFVFLLTSTVQGWNAAKIQIEELEETLHSTEQSSLKTKQSLQNEIDS